MPATFNPPPVLDPFGLDADPDSARINPDGSITIPAADPLVNSVKDLLTLDGQRTLAAAYGSLLQLQDAEARLQAATDLMPSLEAQAKLVPALQSQVDQLTVQVDTLAKLVQTGASAAPAEQAVDPDSLKPIPGALIYPVDPFYTAAAWSQPVRDRLDRKDSVVGLIGPAGVGKTKCVLEHAALRKMPLVYLNCKGSDPNEWFEYRSVVNGQTEWTDGKLTAVIRQGSPCWILVDEPDTSSADFQMRMASVLESDWRQRQVVTPFGTFPVPRCIKFVLAMNGNGTNPSSRHRGVLTAALQNRVTWVRAPLVEAMELSTILCRARPALSAQNRNDIAECVVRLMSAATDGKLDADVSIRTAFKVADDLDLGPQIAWNGALLDGLDDPAMRAHAVGILADRFTLA